MNKRILQVAPAVSAASTTALIDLPFAEPGLPATLAETPSASGMPLPAPKATKPSPPARRQRSAPVPVNPRLFAATAHFDDHATNRQAELFYLQKQIQLQTQMVIVLEDGTRVYGIIEWYDRHSIKVRGKSRVLVYKSAIKYLYKAGESGSGPEL